MHTEKFSIKKRLLSFYYAFNGIKNAFYTQHNIWIHLFATIFVIASAFIFKISTTEWLIIILCISIVFAAEIFNSAIELLTDMVSPEINQKAGKVKDMAAAAVLITAAGAFVSGLIIFIPKIYQLIF